MKKRLVKILLIVTCLLTIFVAGGTYALAHPSYDQECDLCHTNTSVLTLTSNATGTVSAMVGVPFTLELTAGNGAEAMKIVSTWANNNQFTFNSADTYLVEDGQSGDTNSASGEITADVTVTPVAAGTFTIRVWTAAAGQLSKSVDVAVDVAQNTATTLPTTTTTTGSTTTTTSTEPTNAIGQWTYDLISFNVIAFAVLLVLGAVICKRAGRQ